MAILDTTFLIDLQTGRPGALAALDRLDEQRAPARVPAAVWIEFLSGLEPARRARALRTLEARTRFEAVTRAIADEAARLQHELERAGRGLSWSDLQVAATALHYNEALVTSDRSFARVPGLEIVSP